MHLNKLYYINHLYQYYQDPLDPKKRYFDKKAIGFFYSKEEAEELIRQYKKLSGFRDYPEGFYIDEYTIDTIYNEQLAKLIQKSTPTMGVQEILYSICYCYEEKEGDDEIEILAFFSTEEKAQKALKLLMEIPELKLIAEQLDVYEENVHRKEWSEGFIKWSEASEEN